VPYLERLDGCRLYHETRGDAKAPPVVLLEGAGGDIPGWGPTVDSLSARFRVVGYDFRGNGRSSAPDGIWTMSTFVADTMALLDHLGIETAHLYGQSFGGMVAQEMALSHPSRVRSLILAATHCGGPQRRLARLKVPKDKPYLALFSESFVRNRPDRVQEHQRLAARNPQSPDAARRQWEVIQRFDACERLRGLGVPALVLHGTDDRLVDVGNARLIGERIPGARLVLLENVGHVYQWERPEEADGAVTEFITAVESGVARP
jgi:3-oxoadipate enol-lactonase